MAETLNLQIPSPTFEGSTGGWLRAAEVEEILNNANFLAIKVASK